MGEQIAVLALRKKRDEISGVIRAVSVGSLGPDSADIRIACGRTRAIRDEVERSMTR
jgi:hypothetical protein